MKKVKKLCFGAVLLVFLSSVALANGLNLNSLGSRALAMGGAFVGLADDFSALFWNPAGIAQFQTKYFGFYGTDLIPSMSYKLEVPTPIGSFTLVNAKTETKHYLAGMAAYYHPITPKLVAGIGVYVPSGLGANWNGADFANVSNNTTVQWMSKVGMVTFSPALAYKINDMVSVGGALNINYGMFDVKMHAGTTIVPIPVPPYSMVVDLGQYEETMKGWGFGGTIGVLVKPNEMFSVGATFRTGSTVKFEGDASMSNLNKLGLRTTSPLKRDIDWPMWLAAGVAFRPIQNLILTGDIQYTNWAKIEMITTTYTDSYWQTMMTMAGETDREMFWRNGTQIRFGAEYKFNEKFAVRGGYYYDPSPAPDKTMNVLLPNFDFNVVTFGVGYYANGLQIDAAVEYLMAKERTISFDYEFAMPGTYKMSLFVPNISISYRFK
jgi:long-chain fatty acid transport protein